MKSIPESIPVYVQRPNEPPGVLVGEGYDNWTAEHVAKAVGVPEGCFLEGKIIRRNKKGDHNRYGLPPVRWSIIANVRFSPRKVD